MSQVRTLTVLKIKHYHFFHFSGYRGPGGALHGGKYSSCTGGAVGYVDRLILGNYRYRFPTTREIYKSQAFDPEGILGKINERNV